MHSSNTEENGFHAKKKSLRPNEQRRKDVAAKRGAWRKKLKEIDWRRLVFLDETGAKTNMTRRFARTRKGERAVDFAPHGHWHTTTLLAAITPETTFAPMVLEGAMDSLAFEAYVEHILIPELPPDSIVVMDNLSSHKSPAVSKLLSDAGFELWFLPPYSPDFNPIEMMWSKIKTFLRSAKARTQEDLYKAVGEALNQITSSDTSSFFYESAVGII